jgi:hypothetical protein
MQADRIPATSSPQDLWDRKAERIHGAPRAPQRDAGEVVVTGIHLTFENVFFLALMFTISQAIIGTVIGVALYFLGVIG